MSGWNNWWSGRIAMVKSCTGSPWESSAYRGATSCRLLCFQLHGQPSRLGASCSPNNFLRSPVSRKGEWHSSATADGVDVHNASNLAFL